MNLTQAPHRALSMRPHATATVLGERRRTFAEFADRVARLAGALQSIGVAPGDRVGILSLNSDRYVEYYMAVPWANAVVNAVNIRWSAAEIAYSLDDCDTRVLIVDDQFAPMIPELRQRSKSLRTVIHASDRAAPEGMLSYEAMIAGAAPVRDAMRPASEVAGVFYTGGTTGFPKGVMLSGAALTINALTMVAEDAVREGAVGLLTLPLFHIAGLLLMTSHWVVGATQVAIPGFTPAGWFGAIQKHRITSASLVPTMIQMAVDHPDIAKFDLSSLETLAYGGSPISEAVLERAQRALPGVRLYQVYGMTELAPIITLLRPEAHGRGPEFKDRIRSGGRPSYCTEVRVVDANDVEVPRGTVGEILVRGPGMMLGYWGKEEATREALRGGWVHTGDAGRMDEEGFLFVVDRVKDMIVTGGENVYSAEVEQALASHPAIAACAVIGVPDQDWGERVHACVVLKPGAEATADSVREHCKQFIAGYKCPRSVEFLAALPISGAGKVLKTKLREAHWAGHERRVG
jgi:acyl-CoA synthetase (AMP-forming)/AMP-acid ligase II